MIGSATQLERTKDQESIKDATTYRIPGSTAGPAPWAIDMRKTMDAMSSVGANAIAIINAHTRLYAVIGKPVRHSLSPVLHNGAFRRMGLNATYVALEVQDLPKAVAGIRGLGVQGVSVTLPFKTEMLPLLDELTEAASEIGAVNTISNHDGKLVGHNTDWIGAVGSLEARIEVRDKRVLLLGAGGAARAIAYGLKKAGCQVFILNRTVEKAASIARHLGIYCLDPDALRDLKPEVIVNATPVGMTPRSEDSPLAKGILREGMLVMDSVYSPLQTRLLRDAEDKGCWTIDGLEMLARQGSAQLEIWTGRRPEVSEIKKDLYKALG